MITAGKLAARAHRRLALLERDAADDPMLRECRTSRCVSCSQCRELSPLTGVPWAVLHARTRGRVDRTDAGGRLHRDPYLELLECELRERHDRAFIRERDRQVAAAAAIQAEWERSDAQRADRELVAAVADRTARGAA